MKVAIHNRPGSYSDRWIEYCRENNVDFKIVNAYESDIVKQVEDCDAFMWHHHQSNYKDALFAKQLLFSLEQAGKIVFPNFLTGWHFDDKLGQKYLFEANKIKVAKAYAFYSKKEALAWIEATNFPKIFKLRGGAGSANVYMIHNKAEARKVIKKAFGKGFSQFNGLRYFKDRLKAYSSSQISFYSLCKSFGRILISPEFAKMHSPEKGYVYFQEFIPNDGFDYRIEIVGDKAIGMIRRTRKGDFRASGGGFQDYEATDLLTKDVFDFAFGVVDKLGLQAAALDIVRNNQTNELFLIESSYCYGVDDDEFDHGYWTRDGIRHNKLFNGIDWMLENVISNIKEKNGVCKSSFWR